MLILPEAEDCPRLDRAGGDLSVVVYREVQLTIDHAVEVAGEVALLVQDAPARELTKLTVDQQLGKHPRVVRPEELREQTLLCRSSQIVSDSNCCSLMVSGGRRKQLLGVELFGSRLSLAAEFEQLSDLHDRQRIFALAVCINKLW